jgi:hypothetical protein
LRAVLATVEDLLAIAEHSPWTEDALYKAGLRAVVASSYYRAARGVAPWDPGQAAQQVILKERRLWGPPNVVFGWVRLK